MGSRHLAQVQAGNIIASRFYSHGAHESDEGDEGWREGLTKGAIRTTLAEQNELKPKQCAGIMDSLAALATAEVKKAGKFVIPGLCMIKTRHKPSTKAGTRMAFGKEVKVKAKAARTIVKAYPVAALKQHFK